MHSRQQRQQQHTGVLHNSTALVAGSVQAVHWRTALLPGACFVLLLLLLLMMMVILTVVLNTISQQFSKITFVT